MTYTKGRIVNDADSHTMETQDWLAAHLEGEYKEMYSQVYSKREGGDRIVKMIDAAKARKSNPEERAKVAANPIEGPKGWLGYGGFDKEERVEALDWLGFNSQLVFPTFGLGAITKAESDDQQTQQKCGCKNAKSFTDIQPGDGLYHARKDEHGCGDNTADVETKTGAGGAEVIGK